MRIEQKSSVLLLLIAIGNIIKCVMGGYSLPFYFSHSGIFVLIAFILQFKNVNINNKVSSSLMLLFSVLSAIPSDANSLNVIFFFVFSIGITRFKSIVYWIYGIIVSTIIVIRFDILMIEPSSTINYFAATLFIVLFYHHYIHPKIYPKPKPTTLYRNPDKVPYVVVDIMELILKDYKYKQIPEKLGIELSEAGVGQKLKRCRDSLNLASNEELAIYLHINNYICLEDDKFKIM